MSMCFRNTLILNDIPFSLEKTEDPNMPSALSDDTININVYHLLMLVMMYQMKIQMMRMDSEDENE